jgi:hypothetical protein
VESRRFGCGARILNLRPFGMSRKDPRIASMFTASASLLCQLFHPFTASRLAVPSRRLPHSLSTWHNRWS